MTADRSSILLSGHLARKRADWGARFAKLLCGLLALIGAAPVVLTLLVRLPQVRSRMVAEVQKVLAKEHVRASFAIEMSLWPVAVELSNVRVESIDGRGPAFVAPKAVLKPRLFALFAGKVVIEQVDLTSPRARIVLSKKGIDNLGIKFPESNGDQGPFRAPFGVVSMSDANIDLSYEGNRLELFGLDADVSAEDDARVGSSFEVAVRANRVATTRRREDQEAGFIVLATDEDEVCGLDGRIRFDPPGTIFVRRLSLHGGVDMDPGEGTFPGCALAETDKRRIELTAGRVTIELPKGNEKIPKIAGHIAARAPLGIVNRLTDLEPPDTDGWVSVDANVRYSPQAKLPETDGKITIHDVRVDKFAFAQSIESTISIHRDVIASPETRVKIADGVAVLTNVTVEPYAVGRPMKASLHAKNAVFDTLLKNLGVHKHPHVGWDLIDVEVPNFRGTLEPLNLEGDLRATTANFGIYDAPVDGPSKKRIIGFANGSLAGKVSVHPDAVVFSQVRGVVGKSIVEGGYVLLGFKDALRVEVPIAHVDLSDISPLGTLKLSGQADAKVRVFGTFAKVAVEGETSIQNFVLGDIPFGNILAAKARVEGSLIELSGVKAQKNKSLYEMPSARIKVGGGATMALDADVASSDFSMRDFFALWHLEDDPRFLELDGHVATNVGIRVVLGGLEDPCGGGLVQATGKAQVSKANLFGERFDDMHVDFDYNWLDRRAGIAGADIRLRSFALHKTHRAGQPVVGSVLGSATIGRGGILRGNAVFDTLPLGKIDKLGAAQDLFSGTVSGIATVAGTVEAYQVTGNADVTPVRVNGERFGSSQVHFTMTQTSKPEPPIGKTQCGAPIPPEFNRSTYPEKQKENQGEFTLDGTLLGGQVLLSNAKMSREPKPIFSGKVGFRKLDVGAITRIISPPEDVDWEEDAAHNLAGYVSGDLAVEEFSTARPARARATFTPTSITVSAAGQSVELLATKSQLTLQDDTLSVPALGFKLASAAGGGGLTGSFTLDGAVRKLATNPSLDLSATIAPVNLAVLAAVFPRVSRSAGRLSGALRVTGPPMQPDIDGALEVRDGELVIAGIPGISKLNIDLKASENELRLTRATAAFAGGELSVTGRIPLRGASAGELAASINGRGLHMNPADGIRAAFDCDLDISGALFGSKSHAKRLPRITGQVLLDSLEYSRSVNLDLAQGITGNTRRTSVESYNPSLDNVALDIIVTAKAPIRVKNNLADFQLGLSAPGLNVVGTDQRIGLRGELQALPGGRMSFLANEFELRQAAIRFDDATRIAPHVDAIATTEYRRYTSSASAGTGGARTGGSWRIRLHAYGPADDLKLEMSSEPALSSEDISLLLTVGLTKAEADQLGTNALSVFAYEAAGTATGADRAVKKYIPVDDFRFGSAYSPRTGRSEPNFTVGKRLTPDVQANVTSGISEDRQIRTSVEWRLTRSTSVQAAYDNINTISATGFGNLGFDLRWRLEFE